MLEQSTADVSHGRDGAERSAFYEIYRAQDLSAQLRGGAPPTGMLPQNMVVGEARRFLGELGITMAGDARRYEHLRVDDVIFVGNDGQVGKQEPPTFTTSVMVPRVFKSQVLSTTLHVDVEGADDEEGVARKEIEQKKGQPRAKIERRKCER